MTRRVLSARWAFGLALLAGCGAAEPSTTASKLHDNEHLPAGDVDRGEALATRNSCALCHGADYAGSGFNPNITPASEGIGTWSDTQVVSAFRDGVDLQGAQLCSLMQRFAFSDQEAADVLAFLRSRAPVAKRATEACPGHGG